MTPPLNTSVAVAEAATSVSAEDAASHRWHAFPVPLVDATTGLTDIVVSFTFILDQTLDLNKLGAAFSTVVDAWPILSARIAEAGDSPSGLNYEVPSRQMRRELEANPNPRRRQYYAQDETHRRVSEYWQDAEQLRPGSFSPLDGVRTFRAPRGVDETRYTSYNAPKRFDEVLAHRFPVFTTQATAFCDGTLLSMSMVHTLGDGFCVVDVFRAWIDALKGKAPSPLQDIGLDLFAQFAPGGEFATIKDTKKEQAPVPPGYHVYGLREKANFLYNVYQDVYKRFPEKEQEQRYICIPHQVVGELQRVASHDLRKEGAAGPTVGKSDLLYAWLLKRAYLIVDRRRPAHPLTIVNLRRRRPKEIAHWPRHEFLNGALPVPLANLTAGQILDMPLGELALVVRNGVDSAMEPDYTRKLLTFSLQHGLWKNRATNKVAMFCPSDSYWTALTDWRALKLSTLDWSLALPDSAPAGTKAQVITTQTHMETSMSKRQRWALIGDFPSGVWVAGTMTRAQWEAAFPEGPIVSKV